VPGACLLTVVLAMAVSKTLRPSLVLGAASGSSASALIGKALSEVEYQLYWKWRNPENTRSIVDQTDVHRVLDHTALYASPEHLSKAEFLWSGKMQTLEKMYSNSFPDNLSILTHVLTQRGIELAVLDLTPPYLRKVGVWVVRAIPLGLVPISFGYKMEPLAMERCKKLAKRGSPWSNGIPFTHPFA
jgi:hypothetical protein